MRTAIIGSVFVDIKGYPRDAYVPTGRNVGKVQFVHGGVARNVAENFGALGESAQFVSSVDGTAIGREVCERLRERGVDTSHVVTGENGMGMWLAIFDERGDLAGSISHQPDFSALEAHVTAHGEEIVSSCDSVVLEIDMNERIAEHVVNLGARFGKKVYVIVGNMGIILRRPELLTRVDCFICNEIEAGRLFGCDLTHSDPAAMMRFLPPAVDAARIPSMIVTMGPQGAVYYDSRTKEIGACPAIPCRLVDSTGAGDAFLSGAVMAFNRGLPLKEAVLLGTRLASIVIGRKENAVPPTEHFFDQP